MFIFNSYFKVFKKRYDLQYFYFFISNKTKRVLGVGGGGGEEIGGVVGFERRPERGVPAPGVRGEGEDKRSGGGVWKVGRTAVGRRLLGGIEDRFQSSSVQLVFNLCFGIYSSLLLLVQFFGSVSCAFTGVHRFPCLNLCFGE